jgi:hypothetical protein
MCLCLVGALAADKRWSEVCGHPGSPHDELQLSGEDLLEQFTASTGTPELQLSVIEGCKSDDDKVLTHKRVEILNTASTAPVEPVRNSQQRGEFSQAEAVVGGQRAEARFGRFWVAAPMVTDERGQERHLRGLESP